MKSLIFPEQASTIAWDIDLLYFGLIAMSIFFFVGVSVAIVALVYKYRRKHEDEVGKATKESTLLEISWTVIPAILSVVFFAWGAKPFLAVKDIPDDAMEIAVVGKQWMWKFQHPDGRREINDLHVPMGRPIHLKMISQDVIHSLYIPAFRIKQDALPMYYTSIWFEATKPGKYYIFCAEYCGKDHSIMGGYVYVMHPQDYEAWLESDPALEEQEPGRIRAGIIEGLPLAKDATPLVKRGHELFQGLGCVSCHKRQDTDAGPSLFNLAGTDRPLADGRTIFADDNYLRESILNPMSKVAKNYTALMPSFRGRVSEEEILALIAYIKNLTGGK